ncbi:MAG: peroxiredoxin, partial [Dolichospermum sp.]
TTGTVSKAYGSWMNFFYMRQSYIIDTQGILRATFVKVNHSIHSLEVLAELTKLQSSVS